VTEFEPLSATVLALFHGDSQVDAVNSSMEECGIVLDRTLFYSECGGQIADCGSISASQVCTVGSRIEFIGCSV